MEAEDAQHNTPWQGLTASQIHPPSYEKRRTPMNEYATTSGLLYMDPVGRFECSPAADTFSGEHLSVLELRVMAAYLSTALDAVTRELNERTGRSTR